MYCTMYIYVKGTKYRVKYEWKSESLFLFFRLIRWHITSTSDKTDHNQHKDSEIRDQIARSLFWHRSPDIYDSSDCQGIYKSPDDQMETDNQPGNQVISIISRSPNHQITRITRPRDETRSHLKCELSAGRLHTLVEPWEFCKSRLVWSFKKLCFYTC